MPAYKDKAKGTWYASFYYEDWTGKKVKKMKRGFPTKREALEWERTFLQQQTADLEMTFENFVAVYVADMKGRIKENTWGTKEHILYKKLVPYFGKRKMCDIHSKEVIAWQNEMLNYRDEKGKPYSPVYLKTLHNQLSAIFNHAVRHYNLKANPAAQAGNMGKAKGREMLFWTKAEYLKCFCVTFAESNKGRRWRGERSVDLKRTISAMVGQGSVNHNSRAFNAKNTDRSRSHLNITYCHENIKTVFHELFDETLKRYNDKQTRADRKIEDYYEKIRSSKQEKPFHEIILQVGNKDDMSAEGEDGQLAAAVLDEYMRGFQERNPQLRVFSAHLHMDEATPHLHIDFVPFTTGSKRGLDTRVSLKQALAAQGFKGGTRGDTEWSQWVRSEKEQLAAVMERHGIEWEDKGTHDKHLSVMDYKKEQRAKEIAELEAVKAKKQGQVERQEQRLKELAPAVRNMEQLAAQFSDDPERILPEPGPLESAKSYREKKAKPLLAQIVKVLRSLYRAYVELKRKYERLQGDYGRAREGNERLSDRLQETKLENKALRGAVADFERVKRAFGPEEVERAVEDAKRREAQEREQKKAKRRFRRGAR